MVIADVTDQNRNVLFEVGYGMGIMRRPYFIVNEERDKLAQVSVIKDMKAIHYSVPQDIIDAFPMADVVRDRDLRPANLELCRLLRQWARLFRPRSAYVLLPDDKYHRTEIGSTIGNALTALAIEQITRERLSHRFYAECKAISQAEFVIGDWVSDEVKGAEEKNANVAFLLGFTLALGKKLVILQQTPVAKRMIDMVEVIEEYDRAEGIPDVLRDKLASQDLASPMTPEDDVPALVKRELTTYRIHHRLMNVDNFEFIYKNRRRFKPTAEESAFLELCANHYRYPKWGYQQTEFQF